MRTLIGAAEPDEPDRQAVVIQPTTSPVQPGLVLIYPAPSGSGYLPTTFTAPATTTATWVTWSATP